MYFGFLLNINQVLYSTKLLQFFQVFFFFYSIFFIFFVEITKKESVIYKFLQVRTV